MPGVNGFRYHLYGGNDGFVYNDKFNFTVEELQEKLSIGEEQANRTLAMTTRGAASHSGMA